MDNGLVDSGCTFPAKYLGINASRYLNVVAPYCAGGFCSNWTVFKLLATCTNHWQCCNGNIYNT